MALDISSTAFDPGTPIPTRCTCEGDDISPALHWRGVPAHARSLVLIVDDPDAPDPRTPKMTWVHWVLANLPVDSGGLPEGVAPVALPAGTVEGLNDWKRTGYGGPCPPIGRHRYFHKLYALDIVLDGLKQPTKAQVETAMKGHVLAHAELVGTYEKTGR
jgi:Raf kinase inhibitor-like YbhB/YbcL family protein